MLKARGYTPNETSQYHSDQTLRVLVGTRTGSSDGYDQQAFFFVGGRYIGTDTKEPSATVKVVSQSDTEVTLAYPLYRKNDPLSSPSGGQAIVALPARQRQAHAAGPHPPGQLDERAEPVLERSSEERFAPIASTWIAEAARRGGARGRPIGISPAR